MPTYMESEIPTVISTNGGGGFGNSGFGGDGWWGIVLLALLFGWGRNGQGGFGGGFSGGSYETMQLGRLATTNDVASGFNNSAVLSSLNDIKLGQTQGFAGVQQTLCQGFSGINTAILQSANATERGFATLGYNLANCCCDIKGAIADAKYANERQTCDIITAINAGNQRIIDMYTSDKIDTLNRKLSSAENALNQCQNNAYLINQIKPCPIPAYITCNPNTGLTYPYGYTQANFGGSGCCGCGSF